MAEKKYVDMDGLDYFYQKLKQRFASNMAYATATTDTNGRYTVTIPGITELKDGLSIKVFLTKSYNGTYNTINVNGLGAKLIWFRFNSRMTSHYAQWSVLDLTYQTNAASSGYTHDGVTSDKTGWIVENIYDSTNTWDQRMYYSHKCTTKLTRYQIVAQNRNGELVTFTETDNNTGTSKTLYLTREFDFTKCLYWYSATTTIAAGNRTSTNVLWKQYSDAQLRYTFNLGSTITANAPIYLKITPTGNGLGKVASGTAPVVYALPTSDDGFVYKYLGQGRSTTIFALEEQQPAFWYKDGAIRVYDPLYADVKQNASDINAIGNIAQGKADASHTHTKSDITDFPTIPTKTSQLTNDSGFKTSWRGIQNNLTSDSTTDSLSAKQGKALNTRLTQVENNAAQVGTTSVRTVREVVINTNLAYSALSGASVNVDSDLLFDTIDASIPFSTNRMRVTLNFANNDPSVTLTADWSIDYNTLSAHYNSTVNIGGTSYNLDVEQVNGQFHLKFNPVSSGGTSSGNSLQVAEPTLDTANGAWYWDVNTYCSRPGNPLEDMDNNFLVFRDGENGLDTSKAYHIKGYIGCDTSGGTNLRGVVALSTNNTFEPVEFWGMLYNLMEATTQYMSFSSHESQMMYYWNRIDCMLTYDDNNLNWKLTGTIIQDGEV